MSRRRSDPREFAAILQRLERLRAGSSAAGWVPVAPSAAPRDHLLPPDAASLDAPTAPPDAASPDAPAFSSFAERWRSVSASRTSRRVIFDPGRRGATVLAGLALLGALAGAWYFVAARPAAGSAPAISSPSGNASRSGNASNSAPRDTLAAVPPGGVLSGWPTTSATAPAAAPLVVDVVGKVAAPGVVELPAGARIRDAIQAAGGALPGTDLTALDLASRLSDGQEIFVGIPPPTGAAAQAAGGVVGGNPAADAGGNGGSTSSKIVDLNAATLTDLQTLPGVGPVLAQHILDWRTQHGRFTAVTQLQQVSGIGPSKYAALAGRVRV